MSKHKSKHSTEGEGERLVGSPERLIDLLITGASEKNWALNQIVNEGSKHSQVLYALLLNSIQKLLITIEKSSQESFELQDGYIVAGDNGKEEILFPLEIPLNLDADADKERIIKAIKHAPKQEALVFTMAMQVIEWAITVSAKLEKPVFHAI